MDGQLGLEPDFKDYLKTMSKIMRELKRVLKKDGTCWINLGDTYSAKPVGKFKGGGKEFAGRDMDHVFGSGKVDKTGQGVMEKSRLGIPERFYIDCIDDGWIARNHIPWYKSSSMPSSVKDRFTNKWESIFFFAKSQKYYFNLDEVREKNIYQAKPPKTKHKDIKHSQGKLFDDVADTPESNERYAEQEKRKSVNIPKPSNRQTIDLKHSGIYDIETGESLNHPLGKNPGDFFKDIEYTEDDISENYNDKLNDGKDKTNCSRFNVRVQNQAQDQYAKRVLDARANGAGHDNPLGNPKGKNPGDVFFINTHPFPEAHFATFPVELPKRILRCACPNQVCTECGKAREPIVETIQHTPSENYTGKSKKNYSSAKAQDPSDTKRRILESMAQTRKITGYTKCNCNAPFEPGIVLDPFFGSGTTGVAAEELGLRWIGIELNKEYIQIAKKRLEKYNNKRMGGFT